MGGPLCFCQNAESCVLPQSRKWYKATRSVMRKTGTKKTGTKKNQCHRSLASKRFKSVDLMPNLSAMAEFTRTPL